MRDKTKRRGILQTFEISIPKNSSKLTLETIWTETSTWNASHASHASKTSYTEIRAFILNIAKQWSQVICKISTSKLAALSLAWIERKTGLCWENPQTSNWTTWQQIKCNLKIAKALGWSDLTNIILSHKIRDANQGNGMTLSSLKWQPQLTNINSKVFLGCCLNLMWDLRSHLNQILVVLKGKLNQISSLMQQTNRDTIWKH